MSTPAAQDRYLTLNGLPLHYREWGGKGQPLVLLHGLASNCRIFNLLAPYLTDHFQVVALDQRGHGESEKPEGDYGFATFVADLAAFLGALALERPVLLGHSFGGNVALEYAARHPQEVSALVLVDGGFLHLGVIPGLTWERLLEELAPPDFTGWTWQELLERARQDWDLAPFWSPAIEEAVRGNFIAAEDGTVAARLPPEHHLKILRALWEQDMPALCRAVACPVLIVPARQDPPPNPRTARFQEAKALMVPQAERHLTRYRTVWMEDTVHDIPLQRPQELAEALLAFLQEPP